MLLLCFKITLQSLYHLKQPQNFAVVIDHQKMWVF